MKNYLTGQKEDLESDQATALAGGDPIRSCRCTDPVSCYSLAAQHKRIREPSILAAKAAAK
jgi:hypothetical protein